MSTMAESRRRRPPDDSAGLPVEPEPAANPRSPYDRDARRAARSRAARLSRLPFLYDFALRGRGQAALVLLLQGALALLLGLGGTRLVSGHWLARGAALAVLAAAVALQLLSRYSNARLGRR